MTAAASYVVTQQQQRDYVQHGLNYSRCAADLSADTRRESEILKNEVLIKSPSIVMSTRGFRAQYDMSPLTVRYRAAQNR